jgi:hypothetical protein
MIIIYGLTLKLKVFYIDLNMILVPIIMYIVIFNSSICLSLVILKTENTLSDHLT